MSNTLSEFIVNEVPADKVYVIAIPIVPPLDFLVIITIVLAVTVVLLTVTLPATNVDDPAREVDEPVGIVIGITIFNPDVLKSIFVVPPNANFIVATVFKVILPPLTLSA